VVKIAIISDDLTGANDTGVHLAKRGLAASVLLDYRLPSASKRDVLVLDTDSRSLGRKEAYDRVKDACERLRLHDRPDALVYKKIDSTFRGNIGAECDAVYDVFAPDFIAIAPSFPKLGRVVRNGSMFVNGVPLHRTDAARDPKNPISVSSLRELLGGQTARAVATIPTEALNAGTDAIRERLKQLKREGVPYLLFDAETETDLQRVAAAFDGTPYRVVWAGSAGLANELTLRRFGDGPVIRQAAPPMPGPVLILVGSVSTASRRQLDALLRRPDVTGIELESVAALTLDDREQAIEAVTALAEAAYRMRKDVVLYSSGSPEDVTKAQDIGRRLGMGDNQVSDAISEALGETAARIVRSNRIRNLVLTGGDTAKQACLRLGAGEIELIDELEPGVPLGRLYGADDIYVVTKAGGFGSDDVLVRALELFQGGVAEWNPLSG